MSWQTTKQSPSCSGTTTTQFFFAELECARVVGRIVGSGSPLALDKNLSGVGVCRSEQHVEACTYTLENALATRMLTGP
eukprot:7644395-Prorocentrum_lima.AAC.1